MLAYLGERIRHIAAILGGLGFGLFIDELGKFITSDNNYFYRPIIALIYVVFVLLFLRLRSFERHRVAGEDVYLANALVLLEDAAIHDLDPKEKQLLLRWLRLSGPTGTSLLGDIVERLEARPPDARRSRARSLVRGCSCSNRPRPRSPTRPPMRSPRRCSRSNHCSVFGFQP